MTLKGLVAGGWGLAVALAIFAASRLLVAQTPPDWKALEGEMMRHYQAVLRLDTTNPPGNERIAVEYL